MYSGQMTIIAGTWLPIDHTDLQYDFQIAGRLSKGRYSWYYPKQLIDDDIFYTEFQNSSSVHFKQFLFNESAIEKYYKENLTFIPDHCKHINCVTFLAGNYNETAFIKQQINDLKLYVKVRWLENNLFLASKDLFKLIELQNGFGARIPKAFIVLHYMPSEVLNTDQEYKSIIMPSCSEFSTNPNDTCRYETMPIMKFYTKALEITRSYAIMNALRTINFTVEEEIKFLNEFAPPNRIESNNISSETELEKRYDSIACNWIKNNQPIWKGWNVDFKEKIIIGTMLPIEDGSGKINCILF